MEAALTAAPVVRTLRADEGALWDDFVQASPQGTPFALSAYLDAFAVRHEVMVVEGKDGIEAGVVLARGALGLATNPLFFKHLGVLYAPFAGKPIKQRSRQRRAAAVLIPRLRLVHGFDYGFSPGFDDWVPFHWAGFAQETRYTYRIAATRHGPWLDEADVRVRNDLRRAERSGLEFVDQASIETLLSMVAGTYRRQGAPVPFNASRLGLAVERLVAEGIAETAAVADASGRIAAAALMVQDRRAVFLTMTGYADAAPAGATTLLIAGLIDRTLARDRVFDFEGSMIAPIEAFYRGFGGELTPYFRIWRPGPLHSIKRVAYRVAGRVLGYAR